MASQQGTYLAGLFNAHRIPPVGGTERLSNVAKPFKYHHSGNFAYIGGDRAVLEVAFDPGAAHSGMSVVLRACAAQALGCWRTQMPKGASWAVLRHDISEAQVETCGALASESLTWCWIEN